MGPGKATTKIVDCKYPKSATSTAILGDSQTKYLYQHFDSLHAGTPAFISQSGATISDVSSLLDFVPPLTETLILHVGSNDIPKCSGNVAFARYREMLDIVTKRRPAIRRIYASLVLPRSCNRRQGSRNEAFVQRCNKSARFFNQLLRNFGQRSKLVFHIDHGFEWLPPSRVLASDGLHPSFEGFALLACHFRQLCFKNPRDASSAAWEDYTSSGTICNVPRATKARSHDNLRSSEKVTAPSARMPPSNIEAIKIRSATGRSSATTANNIHGSRAATSKPTTRRPSTSRASENKATASDAVNKLTLRKKTSPSCVPSTNATTSLTTRNKTPARTITTTMTDKAVSFYRVTNNPVSSKATPAASPPPSGATSSQSRYQFRSKRPDPTQATE